MCELFTATYCGGCANWPYVTISQQSDKNTLHMSVALPDDDYEDTLLAVEIFPHDVISLLRKTMTVRQIFEKYDQKIEVWKTDPVDATMARVSEVATSLTLEQRNVLLKPLLLNSFNNQSPDVSFVHEIIDDGDSDAWISAMEDYVKHAEYYTHGIDMTVKALEGLLGHSNGNLRLRATPIDVAYSETAKDYHWDIVDTQTGKIVYSYKDLTELLPLPPVTMPPDDEDEVSKDDDDSCISVGYNNHTLRGMQVVYWILAPLMALFGVLTYFHKVTPTGLWIVGGVILMVIVNELRRKWVRYL
jgi:hypothetical protein